MSAGESGTLEAIHQARHRGRPHALGARARTAGLWPAKGEARAGGEEGGTAYRSPAQKRGMREQASSSVAFAAA